MTTEERVPQKGGPGAIALFVAIVFILELVASAWHGEFADLAAWQWERKAALVDSGSLDGDVAVFGSSVLFHGLDPEPSNAKRSSGRVVNLALNGMNLQHMTQFLERRVQEERPPRTVVLEYRWVIVEHESWYRGPYYRFWAKPSEFLESRFFYWNLPLSLGFLENRVSTIFRYREAIDNWLFSSARARRFVSDTGNRNEAVMSEMRAHSGMVRADFEQQQVQAPSASEERAWREDAIGEMWLDRFLAVAKERNLRVVLFVPPSPPYRVERTGEKGYRALRAASFARVRAAFPSLDVQLFEPQGFTMEDFADDVHMSTAGRVKLSEAFAAWVSDATPNSSGP